MCNALVTLKNNELNQNRTLSSADPSDLTDLKQKLETIMSADAVYAARAAAKVRAAGNPAVRNGKQDEAVVMHVANEIAAALNNAATQAKALPTTDRRSFQAKTEALVATLRTSVTGISVLHRLPDNPQLDAAGKSTSACAGVIPSS